MFLASGQSRRVWCKEQGLSVHQLGYWLRKFKAEAKEVPSDNDRWISLQAATFSGSGVSLRIGDFVVDVESGFDKQILIDVVRTLMAVC
jgi:hypothetical protein